MPTRTPQAGEPAPHFICPSTSGPEYHFGTVAGRYIVLCLYGSMQVGASAAAVAFVHGRLRRRFDDRKIAFFGLSIDPRDRELVRQELPGIRYLWDFDGEVSKKYGALADPDAASGPSQRYLPCTLVLNPALRVIENIPLDSADAHNARLEAVLDRLPAVDDYAGTPMSAPLLIVPDVFEPAFCRTLIELYRNGAVGESGFMRDVGGSTVGMLDRGFKRRKDHDIADEAIKAGIRERLKRRLVPEIRKAFQYEVTHIERYIVACYDASDGGFFSPHRDNTSLATAHRAFACTINLNAEEYEGGDLRFPEFGSRTYRAPTGGAVVFSCSLLHEATPVTSGRRYATLPFLYNGQSAELRMKNERYLSGQIIDLDAGTDHPAASAAPSIPAEPE